MRIDSIKCNATIKYHTGIQKQTRTSRKEDISFDGLHLSRYSRFEDYTPAMQMTASSSKIPINIHNHEIAARIKKEYTSESFADLFDFARQKGVFDLSVDEETGFIKTFVNTEKRSKMSPNDKRMADNIWITDSCNSMELLKDLHPELCPKTLNSLAKLYKTEQKVFDAIVENPSLYEHFGVGHVFKPDGKIDKIYPKTRLESIGKYLDVTADLVQGGLVEQQNYGFKKVSDISDELIDSVSNCTKYLAAIDYPKARSCGAWEEATFDGGMTSDTAIVNNGLRNLLKLMYSQTSNPDILEFRERVLNSKHGDIFLQPDVLQDILKRGEEKVRKNYMVEVPKKRSADAAQAFITHSEILDTSSVDADVQKSVRLLEKLENSLVGMNGIRRYNGDKYKNHNADINKPDWDCKNGTQKMFSKICRFFTPTQEHNEAQWFMVSDLATGYGVQVQKLINSKTPEELKNSELLRKCLVKETEYINRAYGQITQTSTHKANRMTCKGFSSPESYQAVSEVGNRKKTKFVPGTNTPLAWSQSSKFVASKIFEENLKKLEELGILPH